MTSLNAIESRLHVADVSRSAVFYRNTLGFEIGTMLPAESPQFAILEKGKVRLQLAQIKERTPLGNDSTSTLWLDVSGITDLHSTINKKVEIEWGPEVYGFGRREFAFKDPDGHLIILSEVTRDPPSCETTYR